MGGKVRATVQHDAARKALIIIARAAKARTTLTYQQLATALGRKPTDARAMAQVCDLLDAAATLARRPLVALWTVRNVRGAINEKAWVSNTIPGLRDALIAEAEGHKFSSADENAMLDALGQLTGFGNRKAWARVHSIITQEEMLARLEGRAHTAE